MSCAQLYNALQKEELLTQKWPDMELAMSMRNHSDFFIWTPPDHP